MREHPFPARRPVWLSDTSGKADSRLPGFLFLVVLVGGGYIGWLHFVPYWNHRTLTEFIQAEASVDPYDTIKLTVPRLRQRILRKMRSLGIRFNPARDKNEYLEIWPKGAMAFQVDLRYKQVIRLPGMKPKVRYYEIHFDGSE